LGYIAGGIKMMRNSGLDFTCGPVRQIEEAFFGRFSLQGTCLGKQYENNYRNENYRDQRIDKRYLVILNPAS